MQKIIAIDYGSKEIGIAIGYGDIVSPLTVLKNQPGKLLEEMAISTITEVIKTNEISVVVIGLPIVKGKETKTSLKVKTFGNKLKKGLPSGVEVHYIDETRTSKDATKKAVKLAVSRKRRRREHAIAACEILKRFIHEGSVQSVFLPK